VRVRELTNTHRQLLAELSGRISMRLESVFHDGTDSDGPNVGVSMSERGRTVVVEVPFAMLDEATRDVTAREAFRVRLKGRRDRMLFTAPPARPAKHIAPLSAYGGGRDDRRFGGGGRGRR
jgi:hypothetical protein